MRDVMWRIIPSVVRNITMVSIRIFTCCETFHTSQAVEQKVEPVRLYNSASVWSRGWAGRAGSDTL